MQNLALVLEDEVKGEVWMAATVMQRASRELDTFPSVRKVLEILREVQAKKRLADVDRQTWERERREKEERELRNNPNSLPVVIQSLCDLIDRGKNEDDPGVRFGLRFTGLTPDELMQIHYEWKTNKKVHPLAEKYRNKVFSVAAAIQRGTKT